MAIRHKRDTNARRTPKAALVAGPIALVATLSVVGVGVFSTSPDARDLIATSSVTADISDRADDVIVSRSASRKDRAELQQAFDVNMSRVATAEAVKKADVHRWATVDLNVWLSGEKKAKKVGLVEAGKKVLITGRKGGGRQEIVLGGKARWVTAGYLSDSKPVAETAPVSGTAAKTSAPAAAASCTNGSSVPSGVSPNIVKVHEAVCAAFPEITTYGTFRNDGEHAQGRAVDIMTSGARGWQVAEFVRSNAGELGVEYAIFSQKIWSVDRGSEGWRGMSDRGSTTANHYDHVHVTTY